METDLPARDDRRSFPPQTIVQAFVQVVARHPDRIAVALDDRCLTYTELDLAANALAERLTLAGARAGDIVGLGGARRLETVVGCVAILKIGAAYLPLDPTHPPARLAFALSEAHCNVYFATSECPLVSSSAARVEAWTPGEAAGPIGPVRDERCNDLAYVIYTSGSTGSPKGVMLEHAGVLNMVSWAAKTLGIGSDDICAWMGSPAFDISVLEVWSCLLAGARLEILGETLLDPTALQAWIAARKVNVAFLVTPQAESLLALDWPRGTPLRVLATGGDTLRVRPKADIPFRLLNMYGPTEGTVLATAGWVEPGGIGLPSIGRAILSYRVDLLDASGMPVADGEVGEIYIAGPGIARGYVAAHQDDADRFSDDPAGGRVYRTGDFARIGPDGLEFLGRRDSQVKIRGYRIELADVEAALLSSNTLSGAAVITSADGGNLIAYVVPAVDTPFDCAVLREQIRATLPRYMMPAAIITLEDLPRTSSGKIDRAKLPPYVPGLGEGRAGGPPRNRIEHRLVELWCQLLNVADVGINDDFFDLGGQSVLAAKMIVELRRLYGVSVGINSVFEFSTIEALAAHIIQPSLIGKAAHLSVVE